MKSSLKLVAFSMLVMFGINSVAAQPGRVARFRAGVASVTGKARDGVAKQAARVRGGRLENGYNTARKYAGKVGNALVKPVPMFAAGFATGAYAYNKIDLSSVKASASTKFDSAKSFASDKLALAKTKLAPAGNYVSTSRPGQFVASGFNKFADFSLVKTMNANRGTTALFVVASAVLAKVAYEKYCSYKAASSSTSKA